MENIEQYQILLSTVRQQYASTVWTHKIQEKQADLLAAKYRRFEVANIIFASLTSCGIVGTLFQNGIVLKIITSILSFVTVFIASYNKSFDLKSLSLSHKVAANQLVVIRNELLQIISELHLMQKSVSEIDKKFVEIMTHLNKLYIEIPTTTKQAVEEARKSLKVNKDYSFEEDEIDIFLPSELKGRIKKSDKIIK